MYQKDGPSSRCTLLLAALPNSVDTAQPLPRRHPAHGIFRQLMEGEITLFRHDRLSLYLLV